MSNSVNKVILLGRLGKDAETKFVASGDPVTSFSLATDFSWKDKNTGEQKTQTEWTNCVIWKRENIGQYLTKGKQIYVEGRLQTKKVESQDGGPAKYFTNVVVEQVRFCGSKDSNGAGAGAAAPQAQAATASQDGTYSRPLADDDVPF